ncbi:unnamed protein product [Gongylonema pulchrum]|uniref:DIOX_N domain-containing protein n=1 Tax=Gongylonema pulchrum TaxID=637853 RepID=A0A183DP69_9BILA|nr:unnamed protein product [Gongylonema pulchrum]
MSELAERLAADGVIVEECDISSSGSLPSAPFPVLCVKHPHLAAPAVSRQFRNDYLKCLKAYASNQHWYPRFSGQPSYGEIIVEDEKLLKLG